MPTITYFHDDAICKYDYGYPTDLELLNIFPEAREIIPLKLRDWKSAKRRIIRTETTPYLKRCNALTDEFSKAFWKECYNHLAGGFNEIMDHLDRLSRLQAIIDDPVGHRATIARVSRAKAVRIVDLYQFRALRRVGQGYSAVCPLHGDSDPSFRIYADNSWHCFGCGKYGDSIQFIKELRGLKFTQAVSYINGGAK